MNNPKQPGKTAEENTVHQDHRETSEIGATEDEFVPVGGPRSGSGDDGTEDEGIEPEDEITPG